MGTISQESLELGLEVPISEVLKHDPKVVPDLYIRSIDERPKNSELTLPPPHDEIAPVIDMSLLASGDEDELRKLDAACQEWGIFQMINHGQDECIDKMKKLSSYFFGLPLSEKNKYKRADDNFNGYGVDYYSNENFDKKDWNDLFALFTLPPEIRDMKYWPVDIVPGFKKTMENYTSTMEMMCDELLKKLSLLMGLEKGVLKHLHGDERKMFIRLNHYPPCAAPDLVLGMTSHSDNGSLTIVVQDDDLTSLHVNHNGAWIPVKPVPNAATVVIGDSIEAWSNGKYKSNEHRVIIQPHKERFSIAAFMYPEDKAQLNPLKEMIDDDNRPKAYKDGVGFNDFLMHVLASSVKGKEDYIGYIKM